MKNKLLYFGLLVVTLYLAILYDSPMLLGLCLMEAVLPVVSVILLLWTCLLYTSPSPRDRQKSRMPSSA